MSKIKLKTDGERYNQLIEKCEKQLADLAELEAYEEQADKEYEKAYSQVMRQYMNADRKDAVAKQQSAERIAEASIADEKYEQAIEKYKQAAGRCFELVDATARTFIAIVAELIHDNIDVLDGMNINSKQVFLAINEALPEDIFVDTNMGDCNAVISVHGGSKNKRVRMELQQIDYGTHILCCGKQDHFISKERFLTDYESGKYRNTAQ